MLTPTNSPIVAAYMAKTPRSAALHAEAMVLRTELGITHVEDRATAFVLAVQARDARAACTCAAAEPELVEYRESGRLQQERRCAGPDGERLHVLAQLAL